MPHWEPIAHEFEQHAAAGAYNALYDRPTVLSLCGDVRGLRALDLGCGPGFYARELLDRGAAAVVGADASATMVDLARRRCPEAAEFRVHDLEAPLDWAADGSFDLIVMALVLHHLDDRAGALAEVYRALAPGGRVVVSTHHPTADWAIHGGSYFTTEVIEETWNRGWHVRYWRMPLTEVVAQFFTAGFVIEALQEARPAPEMATAFPADFDKLTRQPGFIAFRLAKAGSAGGRGSR